MSKKDAYRWNVEDLTGKFYKIAEDICRNIPEKGKRAKPLGNKEIDLALDFASCGQNYFECENRLFVLGRACGGADYKPEDNRVVIRYDPEKSDKAVIDKEAIRYSIEAEINNNLEWLEKYERSANGEKKKRWTQYLLLEKKAAEYLNPNHAGRWYDCIAYSNLFKFIPARERKNPSTGLIRAQTNPRMAEILRIEIQTLNPTHILLIVGEDSKDWYPQVFREVIDKPGVPYVNVKVVNRPEVRNREIKTGIYDKLAEWENT